MIDTQTLQEDKEHLREILSRQDFLAYQKQDENTLNELLNIIKEKIKQLFPDMDISITAGHNETISAVVIICVIAMLVWLIYWFSKQTVRQREWAAKIALTDAELKETYHDYLLKAQHLGKKGERRQGVRYAFLSLLFFMDHQEWIRLEKWKTNLEYGWELQESNQAWKNLFQRWVVVFERVWYGKCSIDGSEFDQYINEIAASIREGEACEQVE